MLVTLTITHRPATNLGYFAAKMLEGGTGTGGGETKDDGDDVPGASTARRSSAAPKPHCSVPESVGPGFF